jgi:hypothetical protein
MNTKKTIGIICLGLSCLSWVLLPFIGLLKLSTKLTLAVGSIGFITGELLFVLSIFILGKEYWEKIKEKFKILLRTIKEQLFPKK